MRIVLVVLLCLLSSAPALAEKRVALLITNQAYRQPGAALSNTHRDGEILKAALEKVGFKVWITKDSPNEGALLLAIGEHVQRLTEAGPDAVGFFYYSGHGAADRPNGENYLIPTDMPITRADQLPLMAARLDRVMSALSTAGRMSFVVFDACRNVPLQRADKSPFKGFAPVREQNGLLIAFATEPGNVAIDNNLYAKALAEELVRPGQEAAEVFRRVRQRVRADTQRAQSPEYTDRRDYGFHFVAAVPLPDPVVAGPPTTPTPSTEAERAWSTARDATSIAALEAFIRRFGDTYYGDLAKVRLAELQRAERTKQAEAAKRKTDEDTRVKADAERQRLALLQQEQERKRAEATKKVDEEANTKTRNFPTKPVTLIVPWPAGGATDLAMRAFAEAAQKHLSQPLIVENRPGGSGTLGPAQMAQGARPDGYTLAQLPITVFRLPYMTNTTFDPAKDFTYVVGLAGYTFGVVVNSNSPWKTFNDLVADARANPGKVKYGTPGTGTSLHIAMEQIAKLKGVLWTHVPFKGSAETSAALLGGHVDAVADSTGWAALVNSGNFRLLVTWGAERTANWPNVPTLKELGISLVANSAYGVAGPKGMDPKIVQILHDAFAKAAKEPAHLESLKKLDLELAYMSTADYQRYAAQQMEENRKLMGDLGLKGK